MLWSGRRALSLSKGLDRITPPIQSNAYVFPPVVPDRGYGAQRRQNGIDRDYSDFGLGGAFLPWPLDALERRGQGPESLLRLLGVNCGNV